MRHSTGCQQWIRLTLAVTVTVALVPVLQLAARQKTRARTVRKSAVHRRHSRHYRHYTRVHLQTERVREIQEALVKAGFLHEKPDGVWGAATRDAMREYQKQNGFTPTGLPEAKPLMKLGLGPHPLPAELDPQSSNKAETHSDADAEVSSASAPPTAKKLTSSSQ